METGPPIASLLTLKSEIVVCRNDVDLLFIFLGMSFRLRFQNLVEDARPDELRALLFRYCGLNLIRMTKNGLNIHRRIGLESRVHGVEPSLRLEFQQGAILPLVTGHHAVKNLIDGLSFHGESDRYQDGYSTYSQQGFH